VAALAPHPRHAPPAPVPVDLSPLTLRRAAFAHWLLARQRTGCALTVGNAASLAGQGQGAVMDAQGVVFRFNQWRDSATAVADIGQRCDVWVVAPGHDGPLPPGVAWLIVSGADPWFQVAHWPLATACAVAGVPVLTAPLGVWRDLVAQLHAPPSAGLLVLAWLHQLAGSWTQCLSAGIATGLSATGRHHLLASAEAHIGHRHNWAAEARLHARWRAEGLRLLGEK
jgi:hypothetical protein